MIILVLDLAFTINLKKENIINISLHAFGNKVSVYYEENYN